MQLKMSDYQLPEKILFNYDELKQDLLEKVSMYETLVYTDDQIKDAKADKAALNKLKKALNDERIRLEKEYMGPFNEFKAKINEIIAIIDKPVAVIDTQLKAYDDQKKQEKRKQIEALWEEQDVPEGLTLEKIWDDRMLNVSYNMPHVKQKMVDSIFTFNQNMKTLSELPEFGYEAQQVYIDTMDMNRALSEGRRMAQIQRQKEAAEQARAEARAKAEEERRAAAQAQLRPAQSEVQAADAPDVQAEAVAKQWVAFQALLSTEDALALRDFFNSRMIEFKAV